MVSHSHGTTSDPVGAWPRLCPVSSILLSDYTRPLLGRWRKYSSQEHIHWCSPPPPPPPLPLPPPSLRVTWRVSQCGHLSGDGDRLGEEMILKPSLDKKFKWYNTHHHYTLLFSPGLQSHISYTWPSQEIGISEHVYWAISADLNLQIRCWMMVG